MKHPRSPLFTNVNENLVTLRLTRKNNAVYKQIITLDANVGSRENKKKKMKINSNERVIVPYRDKFVLSRENFETNLADRKRE